MENAVSAKFTANKARTQSCVQVKVVGQARRQMACGKFERLTLTASNVPPLNRGSSPNTSQRISWANKAKDGKRTPLRQKQAESRQFTDHRAWTKFFVHALSLHRKTNCRLHIFTTALLFPLAERVLAPAVRPPKNSANHVDLSQNSNKLVLKIHQHSCFVKIA